MTEKGKTLIWPASGHAHLGQKVSNGEKFIITGWMHYPIDNRDADSLDPFEAARCSSINPVRILIISK